MSQSSRLIEELQHNATVSQGRPLEQRLADLTLWYHHNKQAVPPSNLPVRLELAEKAFWISLEVSALLVERLHELESAGKSKHLWVPRSLSANGKEYR